MLFTLYELSIGSFAVVEARENTSNFPFKIHGFISVIQNKNHAYYVFMPKGNGSEDLSEGTDKINNGSIELHNGICRINKEGINKLSSYGNEITNYTYKIEKLVDLSKNYKGFSSTNSDEVIFIYKLS